MAKKKKGSVIIDNTDILHEVANIADISEEWLKIFGSNVNIHRITPHAIDSLKPVGRRALYALHINKNRGLVFRKVSRVMGDTMAFHPHGDSSIADVVYSMGQPWAQGIMLIDARGNFGNARGDDPAAPRYTEARLSRAAEYILFKDLKYSNVPFRPNFDGTEMEPDYLPARIPLILCNHHFSGIGVGVAANIPPFNPSEVIQATIKLMKNPKAKIFLIPDSPNGCEVVDDGQFQTLNDVGDDCTLTMRATYEIDYMKNIITITSLPLQVTTIQVVKNILEMRKSGKITELIDIQDFSKNEVVKLQLMLKRDENPDKFIEKVMGKKTGLKKTYPVEIRVVNDFRPYVWGVKETLLEWIDYRRECVRSIYNQKMIERINEYKMNEVYLLVLNEENSKKTLQISLRSKNREEAERAFMDAYGVSSLQAKTLAKMSVHQFTKEAHDKYVEVKKNCEKDIKEYEVILSDDRAVDKVIIEQLKEADKLFGYPRRSAIVKAGKMMEKVPNTYHLIGISRDGYIKKLNLEKYISIGYVGKSSQVIVTKINNRENLLIFDSSGRISRVGVSSIPDMEYEDIGVELTRYFTLNGEPVSIINESNASIDDDSEIILITEHGIGKKVKMSEFAKIKDFKGVMNVDENDKLISAIPAGEEEFIIYTNFGDGIRLHTNDIKRQSRTAKGLSLISLKQSEKVVGIDFLEDACDMVLYITSNGRMKLTKEKFLPVMKRKDEPISLIGLEANEYLIAVAFVSKTDKVVVYRKKSGPVEIEISTIPVTSRVAKADKIVKTPRGDQVTGFKIVRRK